MKSEHPNTENSDVNKEGREIANSEIRYVPVDYLPEFNQNDNYDTDVIEILKRLWDGRFIIVKIVGLFVFLGVFWALFSAEEYVSESILMPEVPQQQNMGGAGNLLRQFGLGGNFGGAVQGGNIPPMLYPQIVSSLSFQRELLQKEIYFSSYNVTATWPYFLENHYSPPLTSYVIKYSIGLPITLLRGLINIMVSEPPEESKSTISKSQDELFIRVSRNEFNHIQNLRDRISVQQDLETGLLTTRVKLQDPRAAAELNRHLVSMIKDYVTAYRIEKAKEDLAFAEFQFEEARMRLDKKQYELARFLDENVSLATARARTELERIQDEKNLALQVFSGLAQRVEQARLHLQEETPVFTEVQSVTIPSERSEPRRALLVVLFTFLGGLWALAFILFKPFVLNVITEIKAYESEKR